MALLDELAIQDIEKLERKIGRQERRVGELMFDIDFIVKASEEVFKSVEMEEEVGTKVEVKLEVNRTSKKQEKPVNTTELGRERSMQASKA